MSGLFRFGTQNNSTIKVESSAEALARGVKVQRLDLLDPSTPKKAPTMAEVHKALEEIKRLINKE